MAKRIRALIWPQRGFARAWKYLAIHLSRIKTSPHSIAAGFASGAAVSFTPLLGLHFLLAFAFAFVTRGSMIAAALGTMVGNPLTFPLFFSATYWIGARICDLAAAEPGEALERMAEGLDEAAEAEADAAADAVLDVIWPVLSTMLIGALPLIPIAYAIFYFAARMIVRAFARRRLR